MIMESRIIGVGGLILALANVGGCIEEPSDDGFDSFRGLQGGGELFDADPGGGGTWLGNGLEDPNVSGLDPAYGLNTGHGLKADGGLLSTAGGQEVATYLMQCALPAGDSISKVVDGQMLVFDGYLGLAPEWKNGACDEDCQQWVSACLLARTNVSGQSVDLWVAADHPSVGLGLSADYPLREATFYGNVFASLPTQYFCRGSDDAQVAAIANGRTCTGDSPEDCGFTDYSDCVKHDRCIFVDGFPTDCAEGNNASGAVYHGMSTFVSLPE